MLDKIYQASDSGWDEVSQFAYIEYSPVILVDFHEDIPAMTTVDSLLIDFEEGKIVAEYNGKEYAKELVFSLGEECTITEIPED